jgi:hypothetical protein
MNTRAPTSLVQPIASRGQHGLTKARYSPLCLGGEFYQPSRCKNVCVSSDLWYRSQRRVGNDLQHEMLFVCKGNVHRHT